MSVGEFNAVLPLIEALHKKHPEISIAVSTTTGTGQKLAQNKVGNFASVFYFPFDLFPFTTAWLKTIAPDLVVIVETELWPGFTYECQKRNVKLMIVNGRMSPKSFKTYFNLRFFFSQVLSRVTVIGAQSQSEVERYRQILGGTTNEITRGTTLLNLGNLKFDGLNPIPAEETKKLKQNLALGNNDFVIVAGSTHEGEETVLLEAYKNLLKEKLPYTPRLILVPRHPERFSRVHSLVESQGFKVKLFSRQDKFEPQNSDSSQSATQQVKAAEVYILDTIGELLRFYSLAQVAFVGGTIANIGGHNVLEPYTYGIPAIVGPHLYKTKVTANQLLEQNAMLIADNAQDLSQKIVLLCQDQNLRQKMGASGQAIILQSQGAVERTLAVIANQLNLANNQLNGQQIQDWQQQGFAPEPQDRTGVNP